MNEDFSDAAFIAAQLRKSHIHFKNKTYWRTIKVPLSFGYSPPPLSFSCQSQLGSGLGTNQSTWLGVSGSSCYKQSEVVPVANTILTDRASLASMIIREKSLLIPLLQFQTQCNSNCKLHRLCCNYQGLKCQHSNCTFIFSVQLIHIYQSIHNKP